MSPQWPLPLNGGHSLVSPGTRFEAAEKKPTVVPATSIPGLPLTWSAWAPSLETLTRVVAPVLRSCTKTSGQGPNTLQVLVSPGPRLLASDSKATYRPLPLITGPDREPPVTETRLSPLACSPELLTLSISVAPVDRSRTN